MELIGASSFVFFMGAPRGRQIQSFVSWAEKQPETGHVTISRMLVVACRADEIRGHIASAHTQSAPRRRADGGVDVVTRLVTTPISVYRDGHFLMAVGRPRTYEGIG